MAGEANNALFIFIFFFLRSVPTFDDKNVSKWEMSIPRRAVQMGIACLSNIYKLTGN